ncbi:Zn-ribbon domain-containing OB-fold protein [Spirillospora sp. NPDC127200]
MDQPHPAPAPAPRPSPLTAPYWEACRRGELAVQRCSGCGRHVHFPEPSCPYCGGTDLPYRTVSGHGTVHTFSVVHRTFLPGFEPPYVVAWIDLPEGARVFGDVTGCPPEDVRIGMPVRVHFTDLDGFGPMPHWRPAP